MFKSLPKLSTSKLITRLAFVALVGMYFSLINHAIAQTKTFPGIGRAATPAEVSAWDIDVRPDFKGLPAGKGSVAKGMQVWEAKCASCHGVFGESNEVFSPIVGGTTKEDIKTGKVARLLDASFPGRTTLMKLSSLSTLWDYINRAMPWTQPKTLTVEEVYAVTAFILNLGDIVPDDFVLSNENIQAVQNTLPNRNGKTTLHALWPNNELRGTNRADVKSTACMKDCPTAPKVASFLPDFARNAHGNLAEQNRGVGAQRGVDTVKQSGQISAPQPAVNSPSAAFALAKKYACVACHAADAPMIGPSFKAISKKYAEKAENLGYLATKIKAGSSGVWGAIPMPAQGVSEDEAKTLANWLVQGSFN
jgi:S-disulfanyl-L-cysteine oxidoreductase SoxD